MVVLVQTPCKSGSPEGVFFAQTGFDVECDEGRPCPITFIGIDARQIAAVSTRIVTKGRVLTEPPFPLLVTQLLRALYARINPHVNLDPWIRLKSTRLIPLLGIGNNMRTNIAEL